MKPFIVQAWPDWATLEPSYYGRFDTLEEAREAAKARPEPLVDLAQSGLGMVAARRLVPHPLAKVAVTFDTI